MDEKLEKVEEKTLQQLFAERDSAYHQHTKQIVERLSFVFEAVVEVLELNPAAVSWEGIDIHGVMLVLVGKIVPTEAEPDFRVVTIGIPLPVVYSNKKDFVARFLQEHKKDMAHREMHEMVEPEEVVGPGNTDEKPLLPIEDRSITRPVSSHGETKFDYEKRNTTRKRTLH